MSTPPPPPPPVSQWHATRPQPGKLVCDPQSMLGTLKRLHAINDAVLFWNEQRTFKLMLRNDPVDADTLACELAMVVPEDDDAMMHVFELTHDGYIDEPGTFILDSWSYNLADISAEEAAKVANVVNEAYLYKMCLCGNYLIKDDASMCVFCQMTSSAEDRLEHFCSICCEDGMARHMVRQTCCGQHLHNNCLTTWKTKSRDDRCPLCRAP